jgi:hypothetical protein
MPFEFAYYVGGLSELVMVSMSGGVHLVDPAEVESCRVQSLGQVQIAINHEKCKSDGVVGAYAYNK